MHSLSRTSHVLKAALMSDSLFNEFNGPGGRFISVDSERLTECMAEWRSKKLAGIHISSMGAFKGENVEFLKDYPDVSSVLVSEGEGIDLQGLRYLCNLRHLAITNSTTSVSLSQFEELSSFTGDWSPKLNLGIGCRSLRFLTLFKYKSVDFSDFPVIPSVEQLELIQSSVTSLNGIHKHKHIQKLQIERCPKLTSIGAIVGLNDGMLDTLVLSRCRKIVDIEMMSGMVNITKLVIEFGGSLGSLDFLEGCNRLSFFGFFETNVLSGDLAPLLRLPCLMSIGTGDKRHYSHTESELNHLLASKHIKQT